MTDAAATATLQRKVRPKTHVIRGVRRQLPRQRHPCCTASRLAYHDRQLLAAT